MSVELVTWAVGELRVDLGLGMGPARLMSLRSATTEAAPGSADAAAGSGLVEILTVGDGTTHGRARLAASEIGTRLEYRGVTEVEDGRWAGLDIDQCDPVTGLAVTSRLRVARDAAVLRATTEVRNDGTGSVTLLAVGSVVHSGIGGLAGRRIDDLEVLLAESSWLAENRWTVRGWRDLVQPEVNIGRHGQDPRGAFRLASRGSWSSGRYVPVAGLRNRQSGTVLLWQVEHNGAWAWELGETRAGAYLVIAGPTDADSAWQVTLDPGEAFTTVPVALATGTDLADAAASLTGYRRSSRRPHPDRAAMPVIFNDYMETLSGDPSTAALLPLVDAAAEVGAQVFCIDAGWYDDSGGSWWHAVGEWIPSTTRFPEGLDEVLDRIRDRGMVPGLWLEPEVIGVSSPMAGKLPDEAFLQRHGVRLREQGRHLLDMRHPEARAHLDTVFDRLVSDHGIGYFKLDYNVDAGPGTDLDADSPGDGLLRHNRALLRYYGDLLDRYPDVVLENCASGGMRMDPATLAVLQLQSTSDQQDPQLRPAIAAAAPLAMPPEQAANWATPQPGMDDEQIAFCLVTGMLGRMYLSGHLDQLGARQRRLVADGVAAHKSMRPFIAAATPFWPIGLPNWDDPWMSLGLRRAGESFIVVWRRDGATEDLVLTLGAGALPPTLVYPRDLAGMLMSSEPASAVRFSAGDGPAARLFHVVGGRPPALQSTSEKSLGAGFVRNSTQTPVAVSTFLAAKESNR
jgi:alpha-galactosidase